MDTWQRVDKPLKDLLADLPTPPPRRAPISISHAPLVARYPILSALPDDALAELACPRCGGEGQIGGKEGDYACKDCRGTGLVCPRCHGATWVVDGDRGPAGQRPIVRCAGCLTPDGRNATILGFVAQTNARLSELADAA